MHTFRCGPATFLLTGFAWLALAATGGIAIYVAMVRGTPLPPTLRVAHAHGAVIGGLLQLLMGAVLAYGASKDERASRSHPGVWVALNLGTVAMMAGFWAKHYPIAGLGGLLAIIPALPICAAGFRLARNRSFGALLPAWYAAIALAALILCTVIGLAYAFTLVPYEWQIHARLGHVHVGLLAFVLIAAVGLVHPLGEALFRTPLAHPGFTHAALVGFPVGLAVLLGGFALQLLTVQVAAGALLIGASLAMAFNVVRTWLQAGDRQSAATDHLVLGVIFLLLTMILGSLVAANTMTEPRTLPFGSLHLVAYTHVLFLGFLLHLVWAGLTAFLPELLARARVKSHKKQAPYLDRLRTVANRWRALQLGTLTFGTMGLGAVAALTWSEPLSAPQVQRAMWVSVGLLLAAFALFSAKLAMVWSTGPTDAEAAD